jgi:hypothetical protein
MRAAYSPRQYPSIPEICVNPLKTEFLISKIYKLSSYLTGNTSCHLFFIFFFLNVLTNKVVHSESDRDILEPNIARRSISCSCKSDLERNALSGSLTIFGIYCN